MTAHELYRTAFASEPAAFAKAPGRINLIGEHTDYNGGFVLPMALPILTHVAIGQSPSRHDEIVSDRFAGRHEFSIDARATGAWTDYAVGAAQAARRKGWLEGPARIAISSTVPDGAGLSSSAALTVAILKAAAAFSGAALDAREIATAARAVENEHVGVPCGIMDQMIVAADAEGKAMLLDTTSLQYELIAIPREWRVAVLHSGVSRKLNEGRYALRRRECEQAGDLLGAAHLCRLTAAQEARIPHLPPPLDRRARHAVEEHRRVLKAVAALKASDLRSFGAVLSEGHASLRAAFETSTPEIDRLVEIAEQEGAAGARLSGGGFGGCIVAVMNRADHEEWLRAVMARYAAARSIV